MLNGFITGAQCALSLLLLCSSGWGRAGQPGKATRPRAFAGIVFEAALDSDIQKRYGKGYFVRDESHGGGRYFVDPAHRVTLHVELGPDHTIDELVYQRGVHLPGNPTAKMLRAAETSRLTDHETVDNVIALGATPHAIRALYGKPHKESEENGERILAYDYYPPNQVGYDANFVFRNAALVRVYFEGGD